MVRSVVVDPALIANASFIASTSTASSRPARFVTPNDNAIRTRDTTFLRRRDVAVDDDDDDGCDVIL